MSRFNPNSYMKIFVYPVFISMVSLLVLASCSGNASTQKDLIVLTHDSFDIGIDVIEEFEKAYDVNLIFQKGGDAGEIVTKAILTKDAPIADLLYGVDNTFLARALEEDIFVKYRSPVVDQIPSKYQLDVEYRVTPVDYGYIALNFDLDWLDHNNMSPPIDLLDMVDPKWVGKFAVQNPATSSPGLAFLLLTVDRFGETGTYTWKDYWQELMLNEVKISDGWTNTYYTSFTLNGGDRPVVISYSTSPAAEIFYSEIDLQSAPTAALISSDNMFLQVELIGILKGSSNEILAQRFIDFVIQKRFQEDFITRMWVYPVNKKATLPKIFSYAPEPEISKGDDFPIWGLSMDRKGSDIEKLIEEWTNLVMR